jgi:hypothetical protein
MLRSIGAVVGGYFIFAASAALLFQLSGQAPHADAPLAFKIASTVWGAVFALVAGWLAAHISVRRPAAHGAAVARGLAPGARGYVFSSFSDAIWSQLAALIVMAPCAWLGGLLAARIKAGQP